MTLDDGRRKSIELGRDGKVPIFAAAGFGASLTPISEDGAGGAISSPVTERGMLRCRPLVTFAISHSLFSSFQPIQWREYWQLVLEQ